MIPHERVAKVEVLRHKAVCGKLGDRLTGEFQTMLVARIAISSHEKRVASGVKPEVEEIDVFPCELKREVVVPFFVLSESAAYLLVVGVVHCGLDVGRDYQLSIDNG